MNKTHLWCIVVKRGNVKHWSNHTSTLAKIKIDDDLLITKGVYHNSKFVSARILPIHKWNAQWVSKNI